MGSAECPLHLLLLDESSADRVMDRQFHKPCADGLAVPPSFAQMRNEVAVVLDIGRKFTEPSTHLFGGGRSRLNPTQLDDQIVQSLQCFLGVAMPHQMLHAFHALGYIGARLWPLLLPPLDLLLQHGEHSIPGIRRAGRASGPGSSSKMSPGSVSSLRPAELGAAGQDARPKSSREPPEQDGSGGGSGIWLGRKPVSVAGPAQAGQSQHRELDGLPPSSKTLRARTA